MGRPNHLHYLVPSAFYALNVDIHDSGYLNTPVDAVDTEVNGDQVMQMVGAAHITYISAKSTGFQGLTLDMDMPLPMPASFMSQAMNSM